ncbi:acetoacetate decarboxylase family protein [Bordetella genomosp. 12]|uniref:Acetoacetate decarboxylase n=1 Tax=Bordetella genomosp. 12 TaxID=463035 RepID=A0A261VCT1_9BORD|nr:acetoacetate decarboxylase family protein [Bordetella genomosp. 12]OZI71815.1 hypothetical protein CAL22_18655 [Bordetella genomosp. 12]
MSFVFDAQQLYRMPAHFGPTPGPRQGPDGQPFDWSHQPDRTLWAMDFDADAARIAAWLPPGFELDGEPVVRIELQQWRNLAWLAGRGYNTFGVKVPVRYRGKEDAARGHFLTVLWENMPDAIISGREELGYNKIYAAIADPARQDEGPWTASLDWLGHRFVEYDFETLSDAALDAGPAAPGDGILNFKYIAGTGPAAEPDACYCTLTPKGGQLTVTRVQTARAHLRFLPTRWEDMPTQYHIVEQLRALALGQARQAWRVESTGARDLADTRRLT